MPVTTGWQEPAAISEDEPMPSHLHRPGPRREELPTTLRTTLRRVGLPLVQLCVVLAASAS